VARRGRATGSAGVVETPGDVVDRLHLEDVVRSTDIALQQGTRETVVD
jgi:hypothetical protein